MSEFRPLVPMDAKASSRLSRPRHHEAVSRMKLSNAGSVYWLTAEELQVEPGSQLGDPGG
jgi:hypothetical protein